MSKKYRVKVIALSLKNNKIAKHGDIIVQDQVAANCKDLVENGYLEKAPKGKKDKKDKKDLTPEPTAKELFEKASNDGTLTAKQLETISKPNIKAYAEKHGFECIGVDDGTKTEMIDSIFNKD